MEIIPGYLHKDCLDLNRNKEIYMYSVLFLVLLDIDKDFLYCINKLV